MAARKGGLGKGIDNLIPYSGSDDTAADKPMKQKEREKEVIKEVEVVKEVIKQEPLLVKVMQIEPNREQPRKQFQEESLKELAQSIRQYGMIQPIIVQKKDDYYEIIAGERRWRAAQMAGISEVPVIVKDYNDKDVLEIALIENIQRQDLNPIEEAKAYKHLLDDYSLTQEEVAERVAKSRTAIANSMRLLKLCDKVQEYLIDGLLSGGHARALIPIEQEDKQINAADTVIKKQLSVRETEKLVKEILKPKTKTEKPVENLQAEMVIYADLEDKLKEVMGTKVKIQRKNNGKGTIEIEYYSIDELERLISLLQGGNQ